MFYTQYNSINLLKKFITSRSFEYGAEDERHGKRGRVKTREKKGVERSIVTGQNRFHSLLHDRNIHLNRQSVKGLFEISKKGHNSISLREIFI